MPSQNEKDSLYMGTAFLHARISKAVRKKVGAALVTRTGVIIPGVNGLPTQLGNQLEYETENGLVTKEEVIHAEQACINKCAREGISCENSIMYVTLAPCLKCGSNIIASGIKELIWSEEYRDMRGVELLEKHMKVRRYEYV